jgi:hypothetical protein
MAMPIGVVLPVLLATGWHTWLLAPIAVGVAMIAGATYCGWKYWQDGRRQGSTKDQISIPSVDSMPMLKTISADRNMSPQDLGQIQVINARVWVNHGHIDLEGITAEYRDGTKWAEILQGRCSRCGRPRNESRYPSG